MEEGQDRSIP